MGARRGRLFKPPAETSLAARQQEHTHGQIAFQFKTHAPCAPGHTGAFGTISCRGRASRALRKTGERPSLQSIPDSSARDASAHVEDRRAQNTNCGRFPLFAEPTSPLACFDVSWRFSRPFRADAKPPSKGVSVGFVSGVRGRVQKWGMSRFCRRKHGVNYVRVIPRSGRVGQNKPQDRAKRHLR